MKRVFAILGLLAASHLVWAQTEDKTQIPSNAPRFQATEDNLRGVALVGAFYNSIARAKSYDGHFVLTKTIVKNGQVVTRKEVIWKSRWTSQSAGRYLKRTVDSTYELTQDGRTEKSGVLRVDDGENTRRFSSLRKMWSQKTQDKNDSDLSQIIVQGVWMTTLLAFNQGAKFEIKPLFSKVQPTRLLITDQKGFELVFYQSTGLLESWKLQSDDGETTELRFVSFKLDVPVNFEAAALVIPNDARQVPPAEMDEEIKF